MTRLQETLRLNAEWVRLQSFRTRSEPHRGYDFRHCATNVEQERARQEAIAAAAMPPHFLASLVTACVRRILCAEKAVCTSPRGSSLQTETGEIPEALDGGLGATHAPLSMWGVPHGSLIDLG